MRNVMDGRLQSDPGQYSELLQEMYALLHPRVREVFEPVLLQGVEVGSSGCGARIASDALESALESVAWKLLETWAVMLWEAAENDPANLLRLETLDQYMLPRGDLSPWFAKAAEEMDVLTEQRIRDVLRRLRKSLPTGTFLPPEMAELIRLEGNLAVTCH